MQEREVLVKSGIVPVNDKFYPYFNSYNRYEVYFGSRGSSKSYFVALKLVNCCIAEPYFKCIYARKHAISIKESQYDLFKKIIYYHNLQRFFKFNETTMRITHVNGNCFIAKGLDDPEKTKSIDDPTCVWYEEPTEGDMDDLTKLNETLRTTRGLLRTIVSFNPVSLEHWLLPFFFKSKDEAYTANPEFGDDLMILHSTLHDNYFIDRVAYERDLRVGCAGNDSLIDVSVYGKWGMEKNDNPWLYAFSDKQVKPLTFLPSYPVYISFDFNADPVSCVCVQMSPNKGGNESFIHFIKEFGGHVKIDDICSQIKTFFPSSIIYITGDRSGKNEDIGRNQTLYQIIQSLLGLSDAQMNLNDSNIYHADSRTLCNTMLYNYPNIYFDPSCVNLISDCRKATVDEKKEAPSHLKKDREQYKMDYFDAMRYHFQTYWLIYCKDTYLRALQSQPVKGNYELGVLAGQRLPHAIK